MRFYHMDIQPTYAVLRQQGVPICKIHRIYADIVKHYAALENRTYIPDEIALCLC